MGRAKLRNKANLSVSSCLGIQWS